MTKLLVGLAFLAGVGLLAGLACSTGVAPGLAAEKPAKDAPPRDPKAGEDVPADDSATDPVARIALASQLAADGQANRSPALLISAAIILRALPPEKEKKDAKVTTEDEKGQTQVTGEEAKDTPTLADAAEALLKEAKQMTEGLAAEKDPKKRLSKDESAALLALAEAVLNRPATRGAMGGAKRMGRTLGPGRTDVIRVDFHKNRPARVAVRSRSGNLGLRVTNHAGVVRGTDGGPHPTVQWTPHQNDKTAYTIRIRNNGRKAIAYQLFTN